MLAILLFMIGPLRSPRRYGSISREALELPGARRRAARRAAFFVDWCATMTSSRRRAFSFRIAPDSRVELLAVVHLLAREAEPGLARFAFNALPYSAEVKRRFLPRAGHAVAARYREALRGGANPI